MSYLFCDNASLLSLRIAPFKPLRLNESQKQVSQNSASHNWKAKRESPVCRDTRAIPHTSCVAEGRRKKKAQRMCMQLASPDEAFLGGGMHTESSSVPVLQPAAWWHFSRGFPVQQHPRWSSQISVPRPTGQRKKPSLLAKAVEVVTLSIGFLNIIWKEAESLIWIEYCRSN